MSVRRQLVLEDVEISREGRRLLGPLSCSIEAGSPVTLMGPSGSGKSSLINWLIGMLPPGFTAAGSALLEGQCLSRLPTNLRRLGTLFQDDVLFPHLNVEENLAFGLPSGLDRETRRSRIDDALSDSGLAGMGGRHTGSLSGGERARIALMRTLLSEPQALLLDEPFSKLDADLRRRLRYLVFSKADEYNLPVLLVSHDPDDGVAAGGPVITLG
jgi:putative thiamine transport system ATP-binding protein